MCFLLKKRKVGYTIMKLLEDRILKDGKIGAGLQIDAAAEALRIQNHAVHIKKDATDHACILPFS